MSSQLDSVTAQIQQSCRHADRSSEEVHLIAVSKTWPAERLLPLIDQGQSRFGENKLQELEVKAPALDEKKLEWHFIGGLQRNKVRKVLQYAQVIHSVDSKKLLDTVDRIAGEEGKNPDVFLQVNVEGEASKGGINPTELADLLSHSRDLTHLSVVGLMSIPRFHENPDGVRPAFRSLRLLRDKLSSETGCPLPFLSMGMSHDFQVAIEEGATHIRVGSALFGARGT